MSAAKRVAHAAETVRARWERQVSTDPQTEAAQALEDTGQLLDPEVAAELVAFRALELGTAEGRVSAKCEDPAHPVWLRGLDDLRGCPWCQVAALLAERHSTNESVSEAAEALRVQRDRIAELETGIAWRDAERARWSGVHYLIEKAIDKGWSTLDTLDVEAELGPEVAPVPAEPVAEPSCLCPPEDPPAPHQFGCPLAEVPRASAAESAEADPGDRLLEGDELRRAVRGHLFGGGA